MSSYREIKSRIKVYLNDTALIKPKDKVLVAVSGGMDSMFLLYALIDLQKELDIDLSIGHINHNIREDSNQDEIFVIEQGELLGIPVYVKRLNFKKKKLSENTEAWARENRYNKLEEIIKEINFNKIATGHHSNDQIETVLQRISEKSGIAGLKGIHKQVGKIIRPILTISRKNIESVVDELKINYVSDKTNLDVTLKRNFFRHQVIPKWEELYPNLGESVQYISDLVEKNNKNLKYFITDLENKIVKINKLSEKKINIEKFNSLPMEVQITLFDHLLTYQSRRKHHWNELERIISSAKIGKIYKIDDFDIIKDRKEWIIRPKLKVNQKQIFIQIDELIQYDNYSISVKNVDKAIIDDDADHEFIDRDKVINKKLILRKWKKGDVFKPIGMKGNKKVSDYLIDKKVSRFDKQNQLVLLAGDEIIWVCGHRISEVVKINDNTKQYLELSIRSKVG